jgi:hypothetical protein
VTVKSHYDSDSVIPFPAGHPNKENKNNSNVNNETSEHDADIDEYRYQNLRTTILYNPKSAPF